MDYEALKTLHPAADRRATPAGRWRFGLLDPSESGEHLGAVGAGGVPVTHYDDHLWPLSERKRVAAFQ